MSSYYSNLVRTKFGLEKDEAKRVCVRTYKRDVEK